jgi:hypothetical protein
MIASENERNNNISFGSVSSIASDAKGAEAPKHGYNLPTYGSKATGIFMRRQAF